MAPEVDVERFWRDGFLVIRGVFAPDEVLTFRQAALARGDQGADLLSDETLSRLLLDERTVAIARAILGRDPVYFGDSNVMVGETRPGFHKDNVDKSDPAGPDWAGRYPIIRLGLYTQDHSRNPNGVDLRLGSHEHCSVKVGDHVAAATEVGDIVVWNLRTSHSGGAMMLRYPRRPLNPASYVGRFLRKFPLGLLAAPAPQRVAMFMTYGLEGSHLARYLAYLQTRQYAVDIWRASTYSSASLEMAGARGVQVLDMTAVVQANPPVVLHEAHVPLPY